MLSISVSSSVACLSALGYHERCLSIIGESINHLRLQSNSRRTLYKFKEHPNPTNTENDVADAGVKQPTIADLLVLRARIYKSMLRVRIFTPVNY